MTKMPPVNPESKQGSKLFSNTLELFSRGCLVLWLAQRTRLTHKGERNRRTDTVKRGQHTLGIWKADVVLHKLSNFFFCESPGSKEFRFGGPFLFGQSLYYWLNNNRPETTTKRRGRSGAGRWSRGRPCVH